MRNITYRIVLMAIAIIMGLAAAHAQTVLKVGSTPTGIPFTFLDTKTNTIPDIMRDVNTGRLKAGFGDYPILAYNVQQGNFPDLRLVKSFKSTIVGSIGIGVRKTDADLLKKVNMSLAKLKANGTVDKILAKWGL